MTLATHVGRGVVDLSARLQSDPRMTQASSFFSQAAAERGVATAIKQVAGDISKWLSSNKPREVFSADLAAGLGHVLKRGEVATQAATGVRFVLVRAPDTEVGYLIRTSYPTVP